MYDYTYVDVNIDGLHSSHSAWSPIQTRILLTRQNVVNRFDLKEKKAQIFDYLKIPMTCSE